MTIAVPAVVVVVVVVAAAAAAAYMVQPLVAGVIGGYVHL